MRKWVVCIRICVYDSVVALNYGADVGILAFI